MALAGRTIQVVSDISLEEQLYLYERARRLKCTSARNQGALEALGTVPEETDAAPLCEVVDADVSEKVDCPNNTVYLLFMEGSTRTRESLRNAGNWHNVKVNEFQAETSSFQKNETITDTMKMLTVYSTARSVFIIRSPLEGVCRWLQNALPTHAARFNIPKPAFLNAGDGRFSHPLGELVDQFSFLEQLRWNRSAIHIALVGDLAHSRTTHSKVDGLKVFNKVKVDLVAPSLFTYPVEYRNRMRENGFEVREFGSIEDYLRVCTGDLATIWYFYQPQFKRCGDLTTGAIAELRDKITFRLDWLSQLHPDTCFFQTLPRDQEHPLVPAALDAPIFATKSHNLGSLNGWDRHAGNAYFLHVVLLGMLFGTVGRGLQHSEVESSTQGAEGPSLGVPGLARIERADTMDGVRPFSFGGMPDKLPAFMQAVHINMEEHQRQVQRVRPGGAMPIKDGLVVDHIGRSSSKAECWRRLLAVRNILRWTKYIGSEGVYESKDQNMVKGILFLPDFEFETLTVPQMKTLASVAPGCTINAIKGSKVVGKYRLSIPERIYNLSNIACRNACCVSSPKNRQRDVVAFFERVPFYETSVLPNCAVAEFLFVCKYCKWPHRYEDIWMENKTP